MTDDQVPVAPGAEAILSRAEELEGDGDAASVALNCLLLAFLERHGPMAKDLGLDADALLPELRERVRAGDLGERLRRDELLTAAAGLAAARGGSKIVERDVGRLLLGRAVPAGAPEAGAAGPAAAAVAGPAAQPGHVRRPTPLLDQLGRDLTRAAAEGRLAPLVGRERELQLTVETLCRVTKRNPVLLGPAGVGKTAIVEGFARLIVAGQVPELLRGVRLVEVKVGALVSGMGVVGQLEERMTRLLAEASGDDVILFIDEIHSILGSGGGGSGMDVAGLLKPALARGDLALIGATTDMEYKRILDRDPALERRFQPVPVSEMTRAEALEVLRVQRDRFRQIRGVTVGDDVLEWLVRFAERFLRNRHFPDKAIDLLEQCIAHAMVEGRGDLDLATCRVVAQQLVGMPLEVDERLERLRESLADAGILSAEDSGAFLDKLAFTMGGHDFAPERPNAVLLLLGDAATHADVLAGLVSEALFGSARRVVTLDMAGLEDHDETAHTRFLGMPYGYVGADLSQGMVQQLGSAPWSTVVFRNVDQCGRLFVDLVADALVSGHFTDAHGAKQYLSDAVVVLAAESLRADTGHQLGFVHAAGDEAEAGRMAAELLGPRALAQCQVVSRPQPADQAVRGWLGHVALPDLAERYARDGLTVMWDDSLVECFAAEAAGLERREEWEALLERRLAPVLVRLFKERASAAAVVLLCEDGEVRAAEASPPPPASGPQPIPAPPPQTREEP